MKYFTIQELSDSDTAKKMNIHNEPDKEAEKNMHQLVNVVLDLLENYWECLSA